MKIKYDMTDNYFKCYNEAQGIIISKKKLLSGKIKKNYSYLTRGLFYLGVVLLFVLLIMILKYFSFDAYFISFISICISIQVILLILYFVIFIVSYNKEKNKKHVGSLIIDDKGITDLSFNGIDVCVSHDKVEGVVISKNTVTIIVDGPIFFFVNNEVKKDIVNGLKKYNKDLIVIDRKDDK